MTAPRSGWSEDEHTDPSCDHDWNPVSGAKEVCPRCGGVRAWTDPPLVASRLRDLARQRAQHPEETTGPDDWPVCWCWLSPGYGHLWSPGACPVLPAPRPNPAPEEPTP